MRVASDQLKYALPGSNIELSMEHATTLPMHFGDQLLLLFEDFIPLSIQMV